MRRVFMAPVAALAALAAGLTVPALALRRRTLGSRPPASVCPAGWSDVWVGCGDRGFRCRVFYPAAGRGGRDAALDRSSGRYPAVVFGHGYLARVVFYHHTLAQLASQGFLVVAPLSRGGLLPDHHGFVADMGAALEWLVTQGRTPGSRFVGVVREDRRGAAGHSMGGGCALLLAAKDPRIVAVSTFAAADTRPSCIPAVGRIRCPTQFIAGSDDAITPLALHPQRLYKAMAAPKQLVVIEGGYHCGFIEVRPPICDTGRMERREQLPLARHLLTAWFRRHLQDGARPGEAADAPAHDDRLTILTEPAR